jgi:hypothetical protein
VLPVPACASLALGFLDYNLDIDCAIESFVDSWFAGRLFNCYSFGGLEFDRIDVKVYFSLNSSQ